MVALVAVLLLAGPPRAALDTGPAGVPLAISSWCWGGRCGAPIAASTKTAVVSRGSAVTVELGFVPRHASVTVAGERISATASGRSLSWRANRGGGLTVHVTSARGWVTYVGRIRLR